MTVERLLVIELLVIAVVAIVVDVVRGALVVRRARRRVLVITLPVARSLKRPAGGRNAPALRPRAPGRVAATSRGPPGGDTLPTS